MGYNATFRTYLYKNNILKFSLIMLNSNLSVCPVPYLTIITIWSLGIYVHLIYIFFELTLIEKKKQTHFIGIVSQATILHLDKENFPNLRVIILEKWRNLPRVTLLVHRGARIPIRTQVRGSSAPALSHDPASPLGC